MMTLEVFDVFSIFVAGLAIGLIGAHYLNKWERESEYKRGVLDTLWEIQRVAMREHIARVLGTSRDKKAGGADGGKPPV
jgi:hypothetical protein